jgi:predicted DCC family thiol-disulfide oxidoreductase YuxK
MYALKIHEPSQNNTSSPRERTISVDRRGFFERLMSVDTRSLSLVRICLALCMLVDLTHATANFAALFSDAGVLPRVALHGFWWPSVENSLYLMSGVPLVNGLLLAMHFVAVLSLLVGYRTRLSVIVCLVFTISLQNRNFITNQASDDLMRMLLFGALFVPLGARWSVDAALNLKRVPDRIWSVGVVAIQIQAMCVYTFGALIKFEGHTWLPGHAVAMALADGTYGTAFGRLFLAFPGLLHVANFGVEFLELLMPLLIWFPIFNPLVRTISLTLLMAMHLSFLVFLNVGIFPFVSFTSLMLFITTMHWNTLARMWRVPARCTRLYYDQDCGFCYKTCLLLRSFCLRDDVPIAKAQADAEAGPLLDKYQSWVVYDDSGRYYLSWDAVCFVFKQSPVFWLLGWLGQREAIRPLGERLYHLIGRNRRTLSRFTGRFMPYRSDDGRNRLLPELLATCFIAIILLYNVAMLQVGQPFVSQSFQNFAVVTRLEQKWSMFAPDPRSVTDWAVARAVTVDGQLLDVFGGTRKPYSEASPPDGQVSYPTSKWKKYYEALFQPTYAPLRTYYAQWLCRTANDGVSGGDRVKQISLILFIEQPFVPNPPPRETQLLWEQSCF